MLLVLVEALDYMYYTRDGQISLRQRVSGTGKLLLRIQDEVLSYETATWVQLIEAKKTKTKQKRYIPMKSTNSKF